MPNQFANTGRNSLQLQDYLTRNRQQMARVRGVMSRAMQSQDSILWQTHSDAPDRKELLLAREFAAVTGDMDGFELNNNRVIRSRSYSFGNDEDEFFNFSQKQLWSGFAREMTKALKRNM
jgi:hypothetical protein